MQEGIIVSCPVGEYHSNVAFSGPDFAKLRTAGNTATFEVSYGSGFPSGAKTAFQAAINVWSKVLISRVPIKISANWEEINGNTLASSGSKVVYKNFSKSALKDVWYPVSLAEAISGQNLNGTESDITITINSKINWSYFTDGNFEAFKYDLMTIVLHEIAHGLGFSSTFKLNETNNAQAIWGLNGLPIIYDLFLLNSSSVLLTNNAIYGNPSTDLKKFLTSGELYFKIDKETAIQNLPQISAPSQFVSGGSISHLDEKRYPKGTINALMSPSIGAAEINHFPGEIILKVLNQLGWPVNNLTGAVITSVEPPDLNQRFFLYPNPVSSQIKIIIPEKYKQQSFDFQIFDSNGLLLKSISNKGNDLEQIEVESFKPGIYFLKAGSFQAFKFVKE